MFETFLPRKNQIDPLYAQIADFLRTEILAGKFPDHHRLPPEPELAKLLGTSRITLRKSLKQLEKQHLIVQKKGMGTFVLHDPDRCYRIAVAGLVDKNSDPFTMQIVSGLRQAFAGLRYEFVFLHRGGAPLRDQTVAARADGLVVAAPRQGDLAELADPFFTSFPNVLINIHPEDVPGKLCVDASADPMREALEHLRDAGCRRIGFITLPESTSNLADRNRSFRANLAGCGLPELPELIRTMPSGGASFENGYCGGQELLALPRPPDAIVTVGLPLSLGLWQAVMEAHLRIPEDIAIIGYDVPSWLNPRFSTILQPHEQVAEYAGNLLIRWLDGDAELASRTFDVCFKDRGSISAARCKEGAEA